MPPRDRTRDIFLDVEGRPRVLKGVNNYLGSTRVAELAGLVGFDLHWAELEHGPQSLTEIEALNVAAECGGSIPAVRVQDHHRTHVLRALETGARIIFVPMINEAAQAREIVRWGKFPPLGQRGVNSRSRGADYGLGGIPRMLRQNNENYLIAQIETPEGVANVDKIIAVEGLAGIFIGPYDLSTSMGMAGQFERPELIDAICGCLRKARAAGKHAGILIGPGKLQRAALEAGADIVVLAGDLSSLIASWEKMIEEFNVTIGEIASARGGTRS